MSMKNSNETIWNRTSDLPINSAVPEPLCYRGPQPLPGPLQYVYHSAVQSEIKPGQRCCLVTSLRVTWSRVRIPAGAIRFIFYGTSRPPLGPIHSPIQWVQVLFSGVKAAEADTDHSLPSSQFYFLLQSEILKMILNKQINPKLHQLNPAHANTHA